MCPELARYRLPPHSAPYGRPADRYRIERACFYGGFWRVIGCCFINKKHPVAFFKMFKDNRENILKIFTGCRYAWKKMPVL
jgi:hypothetical protein